MAEDDAGKQRDAGKLRGMQESRDGCRKAEMEA